MYFRAGQSGLPHDPILAIVAPRPIGWISTMSAAGEVNLAPYSFFNLLASRPYLVGFSSQGAKDSMSFAEEGGDFVFNVASWAQREAMNATSAAHARGIDEMQAAGLAATASNEVRAPRVAGSPAALECRWVETHPLRDASGTPAGFHLVIGEVTGVHIDPALLNDGLFDTAAMQPILRAGYQDYFRIHADHRFTMTRPKSD